MFSSLFLQGWLLYTSKSVAYSLHSVPIQNMYKQPKDFVGIISLSLSLTHLYAQPLVGMCIYRWLSMAIDCFIYLYCRVCSSSKTNCIPVVHPPTHKVHRLRCVVGVEAGDIYWCQLFIMVTIGIAINVRYVVACWIIVSSNDGGIFMAVAMQHHVLLMCLHLQSVDCWYCNLQSMSLYSRDRVVDMGGWSKGSSASTSWWR